jgi:hypothetical protein
MSGQFLSKNCINFIAHLFLAKYSTIKYYLSGISFFQKLNGSEDTTHSLIVKRLLEGIADNKRYAEGHFSFIAPCL